jgi:hypothetical protein
MDEKSVVMIHTEDGKPQIAITVTGLPAGMVKELKQHAWQIIAQFYMLSEEE